jgi:hypothetical protein
MTRRIVVSALGMAWVFGSLLASAQQPPAASRAITVDDEFQIKSVDDPQISADGA